MSVEAGACSVLRDSTEPGRRHPWTALPPLGSRHSAEAVVRPGNWRGWYPWVVRLRAGDACGGTIRVHPVPYPSLQPLRKCLVVGDAFRVLDLRVKPNRRHRRERGGSCRICGSEEILDVVNPAHLRLSHGRRLRARRCLPVAASDAPRHVTVATSDGSHADMDVNAPGVRGRRGLRAFGRAEAYRFAVLPPRLSDCR